MADYVSGHLSLFLQSLSSTGGSGDDGRGLMASLSLCMCIIDNGQDIKLKIHLKG